MIDQETLALAIGDGVQLALSGLEASVSTIASRPAFIYPSRELIAALVLPSMVRDSHGDPVSPAMAAGEAIIYAEVLLAMLQGRPTGGGSNG